MTHKLDDMIEFPKSQTKKTYKEDLECEIIMVKMPRCMSWLDAYDEPIGDLDMMEDKVDNPSSQSTPQVLSSFEELAYRDFDVKKKIFTDPGDGIRINLEGVAMSATEKFDFI
nr:hypothetical protein [Tanacetum cinerariifolium]